ncbi:MAG: ATP-dependent DNA helicase RecG [Pseudomonadota bacterium]
MTPSRTVRKTPAKAGAKAGAKPVSLAEQPVTSLHGVGPALAEKLAKLDLRTVQDVLFHLPTRYEDRTRVVPIGSLRVGARAVIEGEIGLSETVRARRRMLLCHVSDGTGSITLRFFHFSNAQATALKRGKSIRCFGEIRKGYKGLEIVHPEYQLTAADSTDGGENHLTPVYPSTDGVQQGRLRALTRQALKELKGQGLKDWLPGELLDRTGYPVLRDAVTFLHRPPPDAALHKLEAGIHPAQQRLAFEELLAHHLSLRQIREKLRDDKALALKGGESMVQNFIAGLPFDLTGAQVRVLKEIQTDLSKGHPMLRLLQGDVGSGKTVVAAAAAMQATAAGTQVAVMAPTELLAEQHADSFRGWLSPLGIRVVLLTGRLKAAERREALAAVADGSAQVIIGTHALFQEHVQFARLAFVIVDEQHRFGVHQRLALRDKGVAFGTLPHQLVMTATPIPRTLAMTAYADLDCSTIDELPPRRRPVTTVAISEERRADVVARVRDACARGQQAYWVCPLIDESEALEAQAAEETAAALSDTLSDLSVGLVHGRMSASDKDAVMKSFKRGDVDLLVATTVIEVGVDVPNASLMIIENAERMGLAQLHQLRGRVGRGSVESNCVLMYKSPLSANARQRLGILRETNDGFKVARKDLELRGAGELLGTRQTGLMQMKIANLARDAELLPAVHDAATALLEDYPDRVAPLVRRWIGGADRYGQV